MRFPRTFHLYHGSSELALQSAFTGDMLQDVFAHRIDAQARKQMVLGNVHGFLLKLGFLKRGKLSPPQSLPNPSPAPPQPTLRQPLQPPFPTPPGSQISQKPRLKKTVIDAEANDHGLTRNIEGIACAGFLCQSLFLCRWRIPIRGQDR